MNRKQLVELLGQIKESGYHLHKDIRTGYQVFICPYCYESAYASAKNIQHSGSCTHRKITRLMYQATFPRMGTGVRYQPYNQQELRGKTPEQLKWLITVHWENAKVTRSQIRKSLEGTFKALDRNGLRRRLAGEETCYHMLKKELYRRGQAKPLWIPLSDLPHTQNPATGEVTFEKPLPKNTYTVMTYISKVSID